MKRFVPLVLVVGLAPVLTAAQALDSPNPTPDAAAPAMTPAPGLAPTGGVIPGPLLPLQATHAVLSGEGLFAKVLEHDRMCEATLRQYSSLRTYSVINDKGKSYVQEVIAVDFHAPDSKTFVTKSQSGSPLVRALVFDRLVQSEKETSSGRSHRDSGMKPQNYILKLIGEQDVGLYHCLVAEATPRRRDRYLFEGQVWISIDDYGIVRMAGHPARPLSFWLTRADFVRQYQKVGGFWLPAEDETLAQVRLYGKKTLRVKYDDYQVNGAPNAPATGSGPPSP
ncbi:MAG TPA: hypothetical protein VG206_12930 [Terriglobia bacterium]|nr:hypothetical protein [Terriglobia bacterium]